MDYTADGGSGSTAGSQDPEKGKKKTQEYLVNPNKFPVVGIIDCHELSPLKL